MDKTMRPTILSIASVSVLSALMFSCAGSPKPAPEAAPAAPEATAPAPEAAAPAAAAPRQALLLGYAPEGVKSVAQLTKLTHVIAFSLETTDDGVLVDTSVTPNYSALVTDAHSVGVKALVSIGGWGRSGGFSSVAADPARRATFVKNVVDFLDANGFDGFDVDWEYPKPEEMADYASLMAELKAAMGDRLLTSAIGLGHKPSEFDKRFFDAVDLIMLMSYDWGWAPENVPMPEPHAPDSLTKFLDMWDDYAPKEKLVFGIPFYARRDANWGDWKSWEQVLAEFAPADSANAAGGYNYNGPESVRRKVDYAIDNCYRGLMIWHVGQDVDATAERSMLATLRDEWDRAVGRSSCLVK